MTDKLRSVNHLRTKGQARVAPLVEKGQIRGYEIEYRDGRTEAVVRPETVRYKMSLKDEG